MVFAGRRESSSYLLPDSVQGKCQANACLVELHPGARPPTTLTDLSQWTATLLRKGCELGVHGIDAWHMWRKDARSWRESPPSQASPGSVSECIGCCRTQNTFRILEEAGYAYDSSVGYNETIGYRSGTTQVFRPLGTRTFLELPMHIQDGAMFYAQRLDLSESEAWRRCGDFIDNARKFGGCLTVLWHDRSHGPERYWGDFYIRLIQALKSLDGWFGTASQTVNWFRKRREVRFEVVEDANGTARTCLRYHGEEIWPPLKIRVHHTLGGAKDSDSRGGTTPSFLDIPWNGVTGDELDRVLGKVCEYSGKPAEAESQTEIRELRDRRGLPARFLS